MAKPRPTPLENLQSQDGWLAYLSAAHLMLFYLGGRFYGAAQRLAGVEYITTYPRGRGINRRVMRCWVSCWVFSWG